MLEKQNNLTDNNENSTSSNNNIFETVDKQ
jgi:hypothetical protein